GPSVAVAVIASAVVRGLVLPITSDGSEIEVAPLWIATVCVVPLLFMFTTETDTDRTAPRSLTARRWALLGIAVLTSAVIALAAFPTAIGEWGLIATWRDAVALLGLGLLSLAVLPPAAIWVAPLVAALASMMFSWPLHPGLSLGLWGALRAPADLLLDPGVPNLSIPLCLLIGAAGVVVLVNGLTWSPRPTAPVGRPPHRTVTLHRSSARAGIRRASLAVRWPAWSPSSRPGRG
ncbi:MAG: hypothetical protein L0I14_13325, partial [Acidipropionibacterium jensenii]|nr:hypothetical protein [Acidipropionibacterium jensenii]